MATIVKAQDTDSFCNRAPTIHDIIQYDAKHRHQVQVKLSCESCYKSKVKCSRHKPICNRCKKSGRNCVYERRKPKQRIYAVIAALEDQVRKQQGISRDIPVDLRDIIQYSFYHYPPSLPVFDVNNALLPLYNTKTELGWKLLDFMFSRYATIKSGAVHYELVLKLMSMRTHFLAENNLQDLQRLISIANPLLNCSLSEHIFKFQNFVNETVIGGSGNLDYTITELSNFHQDKLVAAYYMKLPKPPGASKVESSLMPFIKQLLLNKSPQLLIKVDTEDINNPQRSKVFIQMNVAFKLCFGLSDRQVKEKIQEGCLAFLPYGIAALALFASDQKELLNYCQTQCLKGYQFDITSNNLKKPLVHEFVSYDYMKINFLSENEPTTTLVPTDCEVITINRSLRSMKGIHDEYYFKFIPLKTGKLIGS